MIEKQLKSPLRSPLMRAILAGSGVSTPSYYLNLSSPSNVTIADGQANGTITSTYNAVITASMSPSRTTGVAPLYVNFDMTGTTSTDSTNPTHECFFATDFGDSGAGTWANGVQSAGLTSKNAGYGPVTGHVYETPGTYTVTMSVTDGVNTATKTGTIVVQDPDVVYAGALTICISNSNNFTGAPSGATQVNRAADTDMYAAWVAHAASDKRILFCKADAWIATNKMTVTNKTGMTIGGYGTGVAATFGSGTMVSVTPDAFGAAGSSESLFYITSGNADLRICNMRINSNAVVQAASTLNSTIGVIFYKVEIRGASRGFDVAASQNPTSVVPEQVCLYECLVDEVYGYAFFDTPSVTASFDATTDIFSATAHGYAINDPVVLRGTVPAGLVTDNAATYYISATSFTAGQFRLSLTNGGAAIDLTSTGSCTVGKPDLHGAVAAYIALTKGGIMGCYFDNCNHGEQTMRIPFIDRGHITNNFIARPNQTKNAIKIHSVIHTYFPVWSEKFVVSANYITARGGYDYNGTTVNRTYERIVGIGSGGNDGVGGEWVRNGICENNYLESSLGKPKDTMIGFWLGAPNLTARNNILDFSMGVDRTSAVTNTYAYTTLAIADVTTSTADTTIGVRIYNNTMYSNYASAERAVVATISQPTGANLAVDTMLTKNNILYLPQHVSGSYRASVYTYPGATTPTNVTTDHNTDEVSTIATPPNFAVFPPVALTDWRPTSGYPTTAGASGVVLRDFNNVVRTTATMGAVQS